MRVIAGSQKGKSLRAVPGKNTRPTTDKVKESIFNMVGPYFNGGIVLDLFAGTGGLGIEALSRGMTQAIFVDQDKTSIDVINVNLETMNFKGITEIYRNDYLRALKALHKRKIAFDLVFLDPPYRLKVIEKIIQYLSENDLLNMNAKIVAEHDAKLALPKEIGNCIVIKQVSYGDTGITIFQNLTDSIGGET